MNISNAVLDIKIEDIVPNRFQPREHFADDGIEELAQSIKEHGIIQPLVLRKLGDKYEIVAGERRYKAATLAGLTTVPAIISDIDDNKSAEVALVENIQRRNLTSIEEARSYKAILDKGYLTQEELAQKMGVSQSQIANKLRLLNLCEEVQEALMTQKISERHARALLSIYDFDEQRKWLNRIIKERLTVRQLDLELKKLTKEDETEGGREVPLVNINPNLEDIKNNATDIIAPKVVKDLGNILTIDEKMKEEKPVEEIKTEEPEVKEEPLNTNRFFNFLEDEGPNMNMGEPIGNAFNGQVNSSFEQGPANPNLNQVAEPQTNMFFNTPVSETVAEPAPTPVAEQSNEFVMPFINNEVAAPAPAPVAEPTPASSANPFIEPAPAPEINPFVAPTMENNVVSESPAVEINPFLDNTPAPAPAPVVEPAPAPSINPFTEPAPQPEINPFIEQPAAQNMVVPERSAPVAEAAPSVQPVPQNLPTANEIASTPGIVNPMDSVNNLNPQPAEAQKVDNSINAINQVRNLVSQLEQQGFVVFLEELALPDGYKLNITIQN
ncbi:MAG: ParB/RepB/Spo0J family partition protein [Bacilli bacterium]|nr:ParB/RepB/Spo0J family partition protein [Bacilli bacterium]